MPPPPKEIPADALKAMDEIKEPIFVPAMDGKMWQIANYHKYRPRTPEEKAIRSAKVRAWSRTKGKELREKAAREWKARKAQENKAHRK